MGKQTNERPLLRQKTRTAVGEAASELQHATRPRKRSLAGVFSWLIALGAGGTVLWRSFQATHSPDSDSFDATRPESADIPSRPPAALTAPAKTPAKNSREAAVHDAKTRERQAKMDAKAREGASRSKDEPRKAEGPIALGKELWARFQADECSTRAQALAFVGILSLGPLMLFALAAMGFLIRDPQQAEGYVRQLIVNLMPGQQASDAANQLIAQTHIIESARTLMEGKWWAVAIGLLSLLWGAIGLLVSASNPMNAAWEVKETRGFIKLRAVCFGVFLGAGLLFVLSLLPSSGPNFVRSLHIPWLGLPKDVPWWVDALFWLLAVAFDISMFTVIYKFLPNTPVTWKSALFSGAVVGVLWELFKKGFAIYLAHFGNFNKLYGALGGAVLLVTWIWYSCVILLAGAILCKMYHEHKEEGGVAHKAATV